MEIIAPGTLEFERKGRKPHYDPDSPLPLLQQHGKILKNRDDPGHTVTFKTTSLSVLQTKKQFDNPTAPFLKCPPIMRQSRPFYRLIWKNCRQIVNMDSFLKLVKKCIVSDKLFSELLHVFVEKIVVHPP